MMKSPHKKRKHSQRNGDNHGNDDDDGGTGKNDGRRTQKRLQQYGYVFLLCFGCVLFLTVLHQSKDHTETTKEMRQRARAEALREEMMHQPQQQQRQQRAGEDGSNDQELHPKIKKLNHLIHEKQHVKRGDGVRLGHERNQHHAIRVGQNKKKQHGLGRAIEQHFLRPEQESRENDAGEHVPGIADRAGGHRWVDPRVLPPLPGSDGVNPLLNPKLFRGQFNPKNKLHRMRRGAKDTSFFVPHKKDPPMEWELLTEEELARMYHGPMVDYTKHEYTYPPVMDQPPDVGLYPPLERLGDILDRWPQDELDQPPNPIVERLQHFDYSIPQQREAALKFRDAGLPFKVYNVPEVSDANAKWTDEYVSIHFDRGDKRIPKSKGTCEESTDNFFAFYTPQRWDVATMGPPPTKTNDWTFAKWAKHARYADRVGLSPREVHYYWQSGVPPGERYESRELWTFVSRDLPSFSSPEDPTFFCFHPKEQKGIQCRFGERGVTAATHYDAGQNMVAMITGAKRYILSPPKACSKLGIITVQGHPTHRHSLLNFAHIDVLKKNDRDHNNQSAQSESMPVEEREWLKRASDSMAVETVLKAGEVLFIPSYWFHYITSLQKSAQCNVRSGKDNVGTPEFGGFEDVLRCDD